MAKIEKSVFINAPVEKVFAFMSEPNNILEIWPSMLEVKNVESLPDGGHRYNWVYKMAGIRVDGHLETTEFINNQRLVTRSEGGVLSTFIWTYQPEDGGTRVTVSAEYTLPGAILGKLAEPFIVKVNENEGDMVLANLKARMED